MRPNAGILMWLPMLVSDGLCSPIFDPSFTSMLSQTPIPPTAIDIAGTANFDGFVQISQMKQWADAMDEYKG
jgi:hypothetical protein